MDEENSDEYVEEVEDEEDDVDDEEDDEEQQPVQAEGNFMSNIISAVINIFHGAYPVGILFRANLIRSPVYAKPMKWAAVR